MTVHPNIKGMTSFGWGQRTCLGMTLTQDELLIACGALCWAFNLKRKIEPVSGKEIPIDLMASNSLLIIKPDPFSMAFEPRSEARKAEVIAQNEAAQAQDAKERADFLKAAELKQLSS